MLKDLLSDIVRVDDVLMIVKSNGATSEIRSNSLSIRQKEQWITIGENDGPCHMHVNNDMVKNAEFVVEEKPESCLLYTSPSPRDRSVSRMPSSA